MRDGLRRRYQIGQQHPLICRGPFLGDADIAGTILHGRDAESRDDVAVADIPEPAPATDHSRRPGVAHWSLAQTRHRPRVGRTRHRLLTPAVLGALGWQLERIIERRMLALDA